MHSEHDANLALATPQPSWTKPAPKRAPKRASLLTRILSLFI